MKRLFLWLIGQYQSRISANRRFAACRFSPTCSVYAAQAIEKYGALKGLGLAIWRILRCQPFSKGGYDPVP